MTDLDLDEEAAHYMPDDRLESWEEYDEKVLVSSHDDPLSVKPTNNFCQFVQFCSKQDRRISWKSADAG